MKELHGVSDVADLDRLNDAKPVKIDRSEAMKLRHTFDLAWARRPDFRERIDQLWRQGVMWETVENNLEGLVEAARPDNQTQKLELTAGVDGELAIGIGPPLTLTDKDGNPVVWHRYRLPKGTADGFHMMRDVAGHEPEGRIINARDIVRAFDIQLERFEQAASLDS